MEVKRELAATVAQTHQRIKPHRSGFLFHCSRSCDHRVATCSLDLDPNTHQPVCPRQPLHLAERVFDDSLQSLSPESELEPALHRVLQYEVKHFDPKSKRIQLFLPVVGKLLDIEYKEKCVAYTTIANRPRMAIVGLHFKVTLGDFVLQRVTLVGFDPERKEFVTEVLPTAAFSKLIAQAFVGKWICR